MTAYSSSDIVNRRIQEAAEAWQEARLVTSHEAEQIQQTFPSRIVFKPLYMRVVLAILTVMGIGGAFSLLLVIEDDPYRIYAGVMVFGCYSLLQRLVKKYHHWGTGIDDGLIVGAVILFAFMISTKRLDTSINLALISLFVGFLTYRFINIVSAAALSAGFYLLILVTIEDLRLSEQIARIAVVIIGSFMTYWLGSQLKKMSLLPWHRILLVAQSVSLIAIFLSLLLTAKRQLIHPSGLVLGLVCISVYLSFGMLKKNPFVFRVGLFCSLLWLAALEKQIGHLEWFLFLSGTGTIAVGLILNRYLRTPKAGFTRRKLIDPGYDELMEQLQDHNL